MENFVILLFAVETNIFAANNSYENVIRLHVQCANIIFYDESSTFITIFIISFINQDHMLEMCIQVE